MCLMPLQTKGDLAIEIHTRARLFKDGGRYKGCEVTQGAGRRTGRTLLYPLGTM